MVVPVELTLGLGVGVMEPQESGKYLSFRLATTKDIPELARRWHLEKPKTAFAQLDVEWTVAGCMSFLAAILDRPDYRVFVASCNNKIVAAIGCQVYYADIPPHPLVVNEWMWWGSDKRAVVKVLHHATKWGKEIGAKAIRYVLNVPGQSGTKFTETYRWEVL
jgi:hypothetical protein